MSKMFFLNLQLLVAFFNSCHKPCNLPNYVFSVNSIFFPEKDTINIGDTLWLTCTIPKTLIDINTQQQVEFSNAENLGSDLIISDISKFNLQRGAVDSFKYAQLHGTIYTDLQANPQGVKQLSFEEKTNSYLLQVGLIAKKAGNYILTMPDNPSVFRKGRGKCGMASFKILNSNNNKHLYLFENMWRALSNYDKNHSYCLR